MVGFTSIHHHHHSSAPLLYHHHHHHDLAREVCHNKFELLSRDTTLVILAEYSERLLQLAFLDHKKKQAQCGKIFLSKVCTKKVLLQKMKKRNVTFLNAEHTKCLLQFAFLPSTISIIIIKSFPVIL